MTACKGSPLWKCSTFPATLHSSIPYLCLKVLRYLCPGRQRCHFWKRKVGSEAAFPGVAVVTSWQQFLQSWKGPRIEYLAALMMGVPGVRVSILWRVLHYFCMINICIQWLSLKGICMITPLHLLVNKGFLIIILKYRSECAALQDVLKIYYNKPVSSFLYF